MTTSQGWWPEKGWLLERGGRGQGRVGRVGRQAVDNCEKIKKIRGSRAIASEVTASDCHKAKLKTQKQRETLQGAGGRWAGISTEM